MWKKYKSYIISAAIALLVGGLSALLTRGNMDIYKDINVPPLAPPSFLFPIVWSILYILMGISAALVYESRKIHPEKAKNALSYYAVSLFFNFFWSILFFNFRTFLASFIWLFILWILILVCIIKFYHFSKASSYLLIPYFIWVAFALYLNLAIYVLN